MTRLSLLHPLGALVFAIAILFQVAQAQESFTAKSLLQRADSTAGTVTPNPVLAGFWTKSIDPFGRAIAWDVEFIAFDTANYWNSKLYTFHAAGDSVTFESERALGAGVWALTEPWMDSDSAMNLATKYGGAEIQDHSNVSAISAGVYELPCPPFGAVWDIDYKCADSTRRIEIKATTGELLQRISFVLSVKDLNGQHTPARFSLEQNYPNPFNPTTVISAQWTAASKVQLVVYDMLGREVAVLANGRYPAGMYFFTFDGRGLASGVYFYHLEAGSFVETKKLLLVR